MRQICSVLRLGRAMTQVSAFLKDVATLPPYACDFVNVNHSETTTVTSTLQLAPATYPQPFTRLLQLQREHELLCHGDSGHVPYVRVMSIWLTL